MSCCPSRASEPLAALLALLGASAGCDDKNVLVGSMDPNVGLWAHAAGGTGDDYPWSLDVDSDGNQYLTGVFTRSIDFGGQRHDAVGGGGDIFIASYAPDGAYRWSRTLGGSSYTFAEHIVVAGTRVHTLAQFLGRLGTETGDIDSGASQSMLLLTHDRNGRFLSSTHVSGSMNVQGKLVIPSPDGQRLLLVGNYVGNTDFGRGPLGQTKPEKDYGIVAVYQQGDQPAPLWARPIAGTSVLVQGGAFAPDGTIYIGGLFSERLELGAGFDSAGMQDAFVAHLDAAGAALWVVTVGGPGTDMFEHVVVDGDGQPVAGGWIDPGASVKGTDGAIQMELATKGGSDGVVVALEGTGKLRWAHALGGAGKDAVLALAPGADGAVLAGGSFEGAVTLGPHRYDSRGGLDAFVLAIDRTGAVGWVRRFGGTGDDAIRGIRRDPKTASITVTGRFEDAVRLDGQAFAAEGGGDTFVLAFKP